MVAPALHPLQLRIASIIRRDEEAEHPLFPGTPAAPVSKLAAVALDIAAGEELKRDGVVRVSQEDLEQA